MTEPSQVEDGAVCARCGVEFDGSHYMKVLCYRCHPGPEQISAMWPYPKAWLEEKPK